MKTPSKPKPSFATRKPRLFLSMVAVGFVLVLGLVWLVFDYFGNYAEKTARPLENALVKAGAVKKCSTGDNGRGWDNNQPHYGATFELQQNREKAISIINKVATDNGYKLNHASLANRGPIRVADKYVDNWFYDTTEKSSPYHNLERGKIGLFFTVNNDGPIELSGVSCGTKEPVKIDSGANVSAIHIQIDLPVFKR